MTTPARPTYRVTLRDQGADSPPTIRLRHALKAFLRAYRLRCVEIEEVPAPDQQQADPPGNPDQAARPAPPEPRP